MYLSFCSQKRISYKYTIYIYMMYDKTISNNLIFKLANNLLVTGKDISPPFCQTSNFRLLPPSLLLLRFLAINLFPEHAGISTTKKLDSSHHLHRLNHPNYQFSVQQLLETNVVEYPVMVDYCPNSFRFLSY